ncbi:MAG: MBL fold metallo-hydrolase [Pyrinomonadaceae bacterium]|nr:MBL fold metallo-hydrolase [Pyrinomonadaceae bacterium]
MQSATRMQSKASLARNEKRGSVLMVAPDVACQQIMIVNLFFVGEPGARSGEWTLVDAGVFNCASRIKAAAEELYGANSKPNAIILTHGHFDHIGAVKQLAEEWDVPVYAHPLEMPYLTGRSSYPPPDPSVGGGAMARLSFTYPRGPIDISDRVQALPPDGTVPGMWGWRWIHTPGHTPGHISLFRDTDRTLIAGDAFVTTKQESALAVMMQKQEVNGPPKYYTPDWEAARGSVEALAALEPVVAATGHGLPMRGAEMGRELHELAREFDRLAVPEHGRYVGRPAVTNESGVVSVPPPVSDPVPKVMLGVGIAAVAGGLLLLARSRRDGDGTGRKITTRKRRKRQSGSRDYSHAADLMNRRNVL